MAEVAPVVAAPVVVAPVSTEVVPVVVAPVVDTAPVEKEAEPKEKGMFFEEEAPSDAELRGEDVVVDEAGEVAPEVKTDVIPVPAITPEEKAKVEADKAKADARVVPKGFVPHAAFHEERTKRQTLTLEVDRLKRENELLSQLPVPVEKVDDALANFKVLTEPEEDKLMQEDLVVYQKYRRDLQKHNDFQAGTLSQQIREDSIVSSSRDGMAEAVPGIFDKESDINSKLTQFASENGLSPAILGILTDPKTKVIVSGQKNPILAGRATVDLVKFIHSAYQKHQASTGIDRAAITAEVEKELRPKLIAEITKEITSKMKGQTEEFKTLEDIPGGGEIPASKTFDETAFRNMTDAEQKIALGG